jgi:endonuclease YncB( thermonuclease family)
MRDRDEVRDIAQKLRKLATDMRVAFGWEAVAYEDNPKSVYGLLMAAAEELASHIEQEPD